MNREDFKQELETLINRFSLENGSDTPDFILARYLWDCLNSFNKAVAWREEVNGRKSNVLPECQEPLVNCLNTIDQPDVMRSVCDCGSKYYISVMGKRFCENCSKEIIVKQTDA